MRPSLVITGQHADLEPAEFGYDDLTLVHLHCAGEANPHGHVKRVSEALLGMFSALQRSPDLLVVQGDTSSALGGALAGFAAAIPVAHVEAGLRSHDPAVPWPEEEYRTAIDAGAALLFAPTALAAANLREENVAGAIFITGNTGIDAVLRASANLPPMALRERSLPRLLVTCHRRENWGDGMASIAAALRQLAQAGTATVEVLLHPNPHVARLLKQLLGRCPGIMLLPPAVSRTCLPECAIAT